MGRGWTRSWQLPHYQMLSAYQRAGRRSLIDSSVARSARRVWSNMMLCAICGRKSVAMLSSSSSGRRRHLAGNCADVTWY